MDDFVVSLEMLEINPQSHDAKVQGDSLQGKDRP